MKKQDAPDCQNCFNRTILANAGIFNDISYFYCRNCKFEVDVLGFPDVDETEEFVYEAGNSSNDRTRALDLIQTSDEDPLEAWPEDWELF